MLQRRDVPLWYRTECLLMSWWPTRRLLFQFHRVRKKLYQIREQRCQARQPRNLRNLEKCVYSQNGEDGILEEILSRIGTTNRFFVEFGVQDGQQCCTRNLLENEGWSGVWIECSEDHVANGRQRFRGLPINVVHQFLTAENIVATFQDAKVPSEFDVMVIDVDGNDYWMWNAVAEHYSPRVIVTEYNATFGPRAEWIVPYDPKHRYDETAYFGASLRSFAQLARKHRYHLVGCDSMGVNAFFVREDVAKDAFDGVEKPPAYHYVAPHYEEWFGHPVKNVE